MVRLEGDRHGQFRVDARVDGRNIDLSWIPARLRWRSQNLDAARLGIFPRASEYTGRSQTANGIAKYARARLNRVEVNGIIVRDVDAAVMAGETR